MPIKVYFRDLNTDETAFKFFASSSPMDPDNLPAPVAETGPSNTLTAEPEYGTDVYSYIIPWTQGQPAYVRVQMSRGEVPGVSSAIDALSDEAYYPADTLALARDRFTARGAANAFYALKPTLDGVQSLWQDSAGTIPVTQDGDPVGLIVDHSGGGFDLWQDNDSNRGTYHTDGTHHWLLLGTNGHYNMGVVDMSDCTMVVVYEDVDGLSDNLWLSHNGDGDNWGFIFQNGGNTGLTSAGNYFDEFYVDGVDRRSGASRDRNYHDLVPGRHVSVWRGRWSAGNINMVWAEYQPGSYDITGKVFFLAFRYGARLEDSERQVIEEYAAEVSGVTLP